MGKEVSEIFYKQFLENPIGNIYLSFWSRGLNESDSMVSEKIKDRREFRDNFRIKEEEELLYCRDTSSLNTRDQGLVMTDKGISIINDNNNPLDIITIDWVDVEDVTYKDDVFFFWCSIEHENNYTKVPKSFFYKDAKYGFEKTFVEIAGLFSMMAKAAVPSKEEGELIIEEMDKYEKSDPEKAWKIGFEALGKYSEWDKLIKWKLGFIAYSDLDDNDKAWKMFMESIEGEEISESLIALANYYCSDILYQDDKNNPDVRKLLFDTAKGDKEVMFDDNIHLWEQSQNELRDLEKAYFGKTISERPYNERKLIFPVKNIFELSTITLDHVMPVEINSLFSNPNLQFPLSHPQVNQLYIAHPYNPNIYLLYDDYETEILLDKIREFSEIAQSLGAIEFDVKIINGFNQLGETQISKDLEGSLSLCNGTNINVKKNQINSSSEEFNLERKFNRHQTFVPKSTISKPKNTIWLQGEPSWQRLIEQRLEGGLTSHREVIETKSSRVISGTASNQLKGEIESIFADLNLNWNKNEESRYSEHSNLVLSVDIKFSNIQPRNQILQPSVSNSLTTEELEYKEEYETCLADGEIAASERRLLDRLANKLGLSQEQVKKIEESAGNPLTDEEKEYLDEYRSCVADGPELSPSTRRLLSKMAKSLGLTEEQVNKLENLK